MHSAAAKEQLPTSSPEAAPTPFDYEKVVEKALDTFALGVHVGRSWQAGQVMRWVSAAVSPLPLDSGTAIHRRIISCSHLETDLGNKV